MSLPPPVALSLAPSPFFRLAPHFHRDRLTSTGPFSPPLRAPLLRLHSLHPLPITVFTLRSQAFIWSPLFFAGPFLSRCRPPRPRAALLQAPSTPVPPSPCLLPTLPCSSPSRGLAHLPALHFTGKVPPKPRPPSEHAPKIPVPRPPGSAAHAHRARQATIRVESPRPGTRPSRRSSRVSPAAGSAHVVSSSPNSSSPQASS